ncbi:MAG TPA: hypothetical protein DDZ60_14760 [Planktothrix sp. UBA10369]|jgi:hypothetical protein|nr:hypothetical protein [Planktothrix sp. UBA10369]
MKSRKILGLAVLFVTLSVASPVLAQSLTDHNGKPILVSVEKSINLDILKNSIPMVLSGIVGYVFNSDLVASIFSSHTEHKRETTWKYREFTAQTIKEFEGKLETVNIRKMLNSNSHLIDLFPTASHPSNRFIYIDDDRLIQALKKDDEYDKNLKEAQEGEQGKLHSSDKNKDDPRRREPKLIDAAIRDNFNSFMESLQLFEAMIQSNLVTEDELKPYLQPLFEIIYQVSERELHLESNSKPEQESNSKPEQESKSKPEQESKSESEQEFNSKPEQESNSEPEQESNSEPEQESNSKPCSIILTYLGLDEKQTEPKEQSKLTTVQKSVQSLANRYYQRKALK